MYLEKYAAKSPTSRTPEKIFYCRQTYNPLTGAAVPQLKPVCFCSKLYNLNEPLTKCKECSAYFHIACAEQNKVKPCPACNKCSSVSPQAQKRSKPDEAGPVAEELKDIVIL